MILFGVLGVLNLFIRVFFCGLLFFRDKDRGLFIIVFFLVISIVFSNNKECFKICDKWLDIKRKKKMCVDKNEIK